MAHLTITMESQTPKQLEFLAWGIDNCGRTFEHACLRTGRCVVCGHDLPICCGDINELHDGSLVYDEESYCQGCCEAHNPRRLDGDDREDSGIHFADPGGTSSLRAATPTNPRNLPCPDCGDEDVLTPLDVACGYHCDRCSDQAEGGF